MGKRGPAVQPIRVLASGSLFSIQRISRLKSLVIPSTAGDDLAR